MKIEEYIKWLKTDGVKTIYQVETIISVLENFSEKLEDLNFRYFKGSFEVHMSTPSYDIDSESDGFYIGLSMTKNDNVLFKHGGKIHPLEERFEATNIQEAYAHMENLCQIIQRLELDNLKAD